MNLFKMEDNKFLPPKYSFAWKDLASHYKLNEISTAKSTLSKSSSDITLISISGIKDKLANSNSYNELQPIEETGGSKKKNSLSLLPNSIKFSYNSKTSMSAIHNSSPSYK